MKQSSKENIPLDLRSRLAELSPAKRTILQERLKKRGLGSLLEHIIPRRARSDSAALSFSQQRLWFLDQYEPNSSVYNIPSALRLRGPLSIDALEQSLNEIIRRHESLRTTFSMVDGEQVQMIAPSVERSLAVVNLRGHPEREREEESQRLVHEEARRPFDLAQGPLFRSKLVRLGEDDHVLLLTMHHIVSDGWSMGVLHRELSVLYEAFSRSQPSPLPELPIQYADYAVWQRQWLQGEVLEGQLSYWKKQLEGIPAVLNLPMDNPRPAVQSYRGKRQSMELSKELTEGLKALSRKEGVTLFMTLLAAFQTLLYRYTGQKDIVVGSPIANRNRSEIEGLIGFFVNTLVLRTNFAGDPTFKELLARVREMALGAYAHQDLPFEKLVDELKPERSLSHSPLFQVMFVLQNAPTTNRSLEGLSLSPLRIGTETAKFDLTLSMSETEDGLRGSLQYSTDLFEDATISRMIGHLEILLEAIVADPEQRISQVPILTDAEKRQLLVECNDTNKDYPRNQCIHELFEAWVEQSADAIAVVFEDQQLTYRELNSRSNQLAHYLQELGVGPEVLVGICMERSLEMMVGLLGILKAGGAYVPLDPEYPQDRLAFMLEDAQPTVLITQARLLEKFPHPQARIVCLDRDWEQISKEAEDNTESKASADDTAYVIYTSGTTGQPKGVMISHRNIGRLFRATEAWFHFSNNDVWTMFHSYAFDFSVWEMWGALLYGGRVVIVPFWISRSPEKFYELLGQEKVTVLNQTPSAFRQLIHADQLISEQNELALRLIIFGGEALDFQSLQPWVDRHGDQCPQLVNMYGITETTVHVTYRVITSIDVKQGVGSLIGVPLPDLDLYLLDEHRQLVPIGIPGELYVGGAGVGRSYLNRPQLTDERFIANPFSERKTDKLYKTGDLVRRLSNGDIEYLGRTDAQVKIRGFRIELGEIESVLGQHPAVQETAVLGREDDENPKSDKRLVAYVVLRNARACTTAELRKFLKQKLPEYMIPSAFVLLDTLSLTPNGKIDRKALPAPEQNRPEPEESYVAPRTPVEELLAEIWAEILKLDTVGVHDNFFDLGGHSLLATQAVSRICQVVQVELPLRALFEGQTVARLAKRIEETRGEEQRPSAPAIVAVSRGKDLPLSFSQQRLWFLDRYEPNSSVYNLPSALRLRGSLNIGALEQSLNEIIRRHESLRTKFSMVDGEPVQVIAPSVGLSLAVVDLRADPEGEREEQARRLAREEARRSFDLARGPLVRMTLLRLGQEDHILLLTMHHIVSDGWSMGVLHRELSVLYRAFVKGEPSPLPDLSIQYADYAVWQRQRLQGEVLEGQLSYWKKQLEGIPAVLNLPTDRPRPVAQSFRGGRQSLVLSKDLSDGLRALSRKEGVTLFMTLLAGFQTLLYRYTGQEDIVVGSPIAGRNRREIEGLIGFFVNTLVLRSKFTANPTFRELLAQVRQTALAAYDHQDLPFEKLVEELNPERSLSHSPLFQVMFVLQNAPATALSFEGLGVSRLGVSGETAKFDLTLSLNESADGLRGSLQYNTDLFDEGTIVRMLGHLEVLLESIIANPDSRIANLPLLTAAEEHQLLVEWNDTGKGYPKDQCIHQLFEEQVEKSPEAVAVVFDNQQLTYQELNARANQLARYLRKLGVGPDKLVAICVEPSLEMVVGLLGTLKAGGAYMPLDPEYPQERLAFMLEDSHTAMLLIQARLTQRLPEHSARVLRLDQDWGEIAKESGENTISDTTAESLAYVIYTSGSTGQPKGVEVLHRGVLRLLFEVAYVQLGDSETFLNLSPNSFDASTFEIWGALLHGAKCVLFPGKIPSPSEIGDTLHHYKISTLWLTASLFNTVIDEAPEALSGVRQLLIGGEALSVPHVRRAIALLPHTQIVNGYGPTESTTFTCCYPIPVQLDETLSSIPIGRPIANTEVYLLDSHLSPVPIGVPGELYIGGHGLARSYLNCPDLTAESFIPHLFGDEPGARLYKTGDLARYRTDGNIEFLGRIDYQVKIRGFRIELGEIGSVLEQHPAVRQAVVVAREDEPNDKRLVAYVLPDENQPAAADELRSFLKSKLPEYMIPSIFVILDRLPQTNNGKIDRRALPVPDHSRSDRSSYVAPRTEVEKRLAEIWADVLKVEQVGIHDNFFDLGGHSLLAMKIVSKMADALQIAISLRGLFDAPTVAGFADLVATRCSTIPNTEQIADDSKSEYETGEL